LCEERIIAAHLLFDQGSVSEFSAKNMARAFGTSIHSLIHNLNGHLSDVSLFTDYDERQIREINASPLEGTQECLHHLVEKSATEYPQSIAIDAWDGTVTYTELNELSSRLAHHLISVYKVHSELVIPLCFEKSLWAPVAMLAVLKAGAAYTCLDPSHPPERHKIMLDTIDASLILTTGLQKAQFQSYQSIIVDSELLARLAQSGTPSSTPHTNVQSSNAATVSFTSGVCMTTSFSLQLLISKIDYGRSERVSS
jgi:non-ribosomal peptide synthetase component F